jgi:hypothetical protein
VTNVLDADLVDRYLPRIGMTLHVLHGLHIRFFEGEGGVFQALRAEFTGYFQALRAESTGSMRPRQMGSLRENEDRIEGYMVVKRRIPRNLGDSRGIGRWAGGRATIRRSGRAASALLGPHAQPRGADLRRKASKSSRTSARQS